jgi:hypothetical protein
MRLSKPGLGETGLGKTGLGNAGLSRTGWSKTGWAAAVASCCLLSGYVFAADARGAELAGSVSDSVLARANTLAEAGAGRIQAGFVDDFAEQARVAREGERIHMAFASPTLTQRLTPAQRSTPPANSSFEVEATEQPPNMWLMGGVILLLIGYQLRRKHRLLRPHRFHEL